MSRGSATRSPGLDPFGPTIFLGAFLLFASQPLLGKFLLPWFGGTPAVWTTCLLFFQGALLAGYAYAHLVSRRPADEQRRLHGIALAATVIVMAVFVVLWRSPILPPGSWKPVDGEQPVLRLFAVLTCAIGLPYVILASTGPLVQSWFSHVRPGASPWWLYALSNLGSLLALLAYPTVIEPLVTVSFQAWLWAGAFVVYAYGCWRCARAEATAPIPAPEAPPAILAAAPPAADVPVPADPAVPALPDADVPAPEPAVPAAPLPDMPPSWTRILLWLALAACPSLLLSATTNQMCQEVAPVPFLWIVPLALYLLSFVICFAGPRWYWRWLWQPLFVVSLAAAYVVLEQGVSATFMSQLLVFPLVLLAAAMVCHGELVRLRPTPSHLTTFYLTIAAGGAIGSAAVALVAPRIFDGFWELQIGLLVTAGLVILVLVSDEASWVHRRAPWPALLPVAIVGALTVVDVDGSWADAKDAARAWLTDHRLLLGILAALVPIGWLARRWKPEMFLRAALLVSTALLVAALGIIGRVFVKSIESTRLSMLAVTRNFYGVISVTNHDDGNSERHRYVLQHGRIEHGHQLRDQALRCIPSSYYTESSGFGLAVTTHPRRAATGDRSVRIGMVGLGVGASAALAQAGDTIRFYEINPAVITLSLGPQNLFTFLKECPGEAEVARGDARLSLERELREGRPQQFDVLGIDAFSSDAIPTHLLTTQAIRVYVQHLRRPDGILAVHISNRYLDLEPVVRAAAAAIGLHVAVVESKPEADRDPDASSSTWVLLAPDAGTLARPEIAEAANKEQPNAQVTRVWTDDFTNLLAAVSSKAILR